MNLGLTYKDQAQIRDLDKAEYWFRRSLDLRPKHDLMGRGRCLANLGLAANERYNDSLKAGSPEPKHLDDALKFYSQAREVFPEYAIDELFMLYSSLGNIYYHFGMLNDALKQFQEAIRLADKLNEAYRAGECRFNAAIVLAKANRLSDALEYARSAKKKFETCGTASAGLLQRAQDLIVRLEDALRSNKG